MTMDENVKSPKDYWFAIKRRKARLILPALAILIVAVVVAMVMPPVYRSTGTVLIEEPEVPREFVQSTITSFAAQRLQVIRQRVMTTQNLIEIIKKFDLFPDERRSHPIQQIAHDFREKIALDLVSAEVVDPRSGRATTATIAFNISYDHRHPAVAQQVANELVSLYLNENLRDRREKAAEATGFLSDEGKRLGAAVSDMEKRLAEFKRRNAGQLPSQLEVNLRLIERTEGELLQTAQRLQALKERKILLRSELAQLSPYSTAGSGADGAFSPVGKLKSLQTQYISMTGVYGDQHPDVIKMRREIEALEKQAGSGTDATVLRSQLTRISTDLISVKRKYGTKHPDVVKLERQASSLRAAIAKLKNSPQRPAEAQADNPAYIMVLAQFKTAESEIQSILTRRKSLVKSLRAYEQRVLQTPETERQYLTLKRDYDNAFSKYKEVRAKLLQAQMAQSLETERKSEKFSLIEPPQRPSEPIRPNRIAILFIGLVFAGAAGVGNVFLAESMDEAVYGARQLAHAFGAPPLVVIPLMTSNEDLKRRNRRILWITLSVVVALVAALGVVHYFVRPLDLLWFVMLRRFGFG
jgi:uncharacterized protein involved in exopolysaccharide biosynthesis